MALSPNAKIMLKMWLKTIIFALVWALIWGIYIGLQRGFNIYLPNRLFATMALFLIICSLGLASIVYFTGRFSKLLGYRMYLGVGGFVFGLLHGLSSLFFYIAIEAEKPAYDFEQQWNVFGVLVPNQVAFILGLFSLAVFAFMALISMKRFILKLGGVLWRQLLRSLGFLALFTVLVHFLIKDFYIWIDPPWYHSNGVPPSSLILFILGLSVLILRGALALALRQRKT